MFRYLIFAFIILSGILEAQTTVPGWKLTGTLPTGISGHQSVLLPDGNILITGGIDNSGNALTNCYIYDYQSGNINPVEPLTEARAYHTLVCILIGKTQAKIFLIGGYNGNNNNFKTLTSVEVLDYSIGTTFLNWRKIGDMKSGRAQSASVWDKGNYIIISGGISQNSGNIASGLRLATSERINISSLVIEQLPDMSKKRANHLLGCIIDENGKNKMITAAGEDDKLTTTELLENWIWTSFAFSPKVYRDYSLAFSDIGGVARMFGGEDNSGKVVNTCEWYDVKSGWKYSPSMFVPRKEASMVLIAGIKDTLPGYLVTGGRNVSGTPLQTEYYSLPNQSNPSGLWVQFDNLKVSAFDANLNIAGHNLPLFFGGNNQSGTNIPNVQIYQPLLINDVQFSPEEIGRISDSVRVPIKNNWLLPVKVTKFRFSNIAEFILTGDTTDFVLQPGSVRNVFVRFRPNDVGIRQGNLIVNINGLEDTVKLEGTGIKSSIAVLVSEQNFGEVFIKSDSTICFNAIQNKGTDTTYIDSLIVQPGTDYEVISPKGRVKIPPDSSLMVCLKFKPGKRADIPGSMLIHIGTKTYPSGLMGRGILKYLAGSALPGCDTVNYENGKKYTTFITLRNISDRILRITGIQILGGFNNLFTINQNFPFNLNLQETKSIPVEFAPQSEGTFKINLIVDNDGTKDTIVNLPVCFVARSKNAAFSISSVDFGKLCLGDSVSATVFIENPSYFDDMRLDSININDNTGNLKTFGFVADTLQPRDNTQFVVGFKATTAGIYNYSINLYTSNGMSSLPVNAEYMPTLNLSSQEQFYEATPGKYLIIPYDINLSGFSTPIQSLNFGINYNGYLLRPARLVQLSAGAQLDLANSAISAVKIGEADVTVAFTSPVVNGAGFGIEFEALLGNSNETDIILNKFVSNSYCLSEYSTRVLFTGICGGRKGLISTDNSLIVVTRHDYNNDILNINLFSNENSSLRIKLFSSSGQQILNENLNMVQGKSNLSLNLTELGNGLYFIIVNDNYGNSARDKILIIK